MDSRIRPIRTEQDYDAALARVEELMNMDRDESADDELDVLTTLIEVYEDKCYPMDAPDPITAIKFRMEQLGKSPRDLDMIFGSRAKTSEVLNGKRELTLKMIRALHEHLGIPAKILIREGEGLPEVPGSIDIDRFPAKEMARRGWVTVTGDTKDRVEEVIHELIAGAGGREALPQALFRQGGRANAKTDVHALQAWCLHVLNVARRAGLEGRYRTGTIDLSFLRELARLSTLDDGPKLAREKLAQHGVVLVVATHLPKTYLDGAALRTAEGVPVVAMTVRHDRLDNFWFCLLHELAHLGRHVPDGDGELFIDDLQLRELEHGVEDAREREADEWAEEALIPKTAWENHPAVRSPSIRNALSLARLADVHPAIVAGRLRHEHKNYRLLTQLVVSGTVRPLLMEEAA